MSSPLDGLTFFTDRDLGPTQGCDVVQILRDHGLRVEPHNSHFPEDPEHVDDHVWLKLCADNGWVPLSCDNEIGRSPLSKKVIMEGGVQLFVHRGTWTHPQRALNLANTSEKIARWVQRSASRDSRPQRAPPTSSPSSS